MKISTFVPCETCRNSRYFWGGLLLGLLHNFNFSALGGVAFLVSGVLAAHWLPPWPLRRAP